MSGISSTPAQVTAYRGEAPGLPALATTPPAAQAPVRQQLGAHNTHCNYRDNYPT